MAWHWGNCNLSCVSSLLCSKLFLGSPISPSFIRLPCNAHLSNILHPNQSPFAQAKRVYNARIVAALKWLLRSSSISVSRSWSGSSGLVGCWEHAQRYQTIMQVLTRVMLVKLLWVLAIGVLRHAMA